MTRLPRPHNDRCPRMRMQRCSAATPGTAMQSHRQHGEVSATAGRPGPRKEMLISLSPVPFPLSPTPREVMVREQMQTHQPLANNWLRFFKTFFKTHCRQNSPYIQFPLFFQNFCPKSFSLYYFPLFLQSLPLSYLNTSLIPKTL